jgi:hypothetical protein
MVTTKMIVVIIAFDYWKLCCEGVQDIALQNHSWIDKNDFAARIRGLLIGPRFAGKIAG